MTKLNANEKRAARIEMLSSRIVKDKLELQLLQEEVERAAAVLNIQPGTPVRVSIGLPAGAHPDAIGTALGVVKDGKGADRIKVIVGVGVEAEILVVTPARVTPINDPVQELPAE